MPTSPASNANRFEPEVSKSTAEPGNKRTGYVPPHLRQLIPATSVLPSGERTGYVPPHLRHLISTASVLPSSPVFIPKTGPLKGPMNVDALMLTCDQDNHNSRCSDHKDYSMYLDKPPANDASMQPHETDESLMEPQAMDTSRNL